MYHDITNFLFFLSLFFSLLLTGMESQFLLGRKVCLFLTTT